MAKQAIQGSRKNVFAIEDPFDIILPGLDTDDGPEHELYMEDVCDPPPPDLIESLRRNGQRQAVRVRKNGDVLECVSGRTRVKAARVLVHGYWRRGDRPDPNVELIPFKLEVASPDKLSASEAFDAAVAENVDRKDVSITQKAHWAKRYQQLFGFTEEQIALRLRVSNGRVRHFLSYFDCAPEVQAAVAEGKAAFDVCPKLAQLSRGEQVKELKAMLEENGGQRVSARQAAARVKIAKNGSANKATLGDGSRESSALTGRDIRRLILDAQTIVREKGEWPIDLSGKTPEEAFVLGLRIATQDVSPSVVGGLRAWARKLAPAKRKSSDARL